MPNYQVSSYGSSASFPESHPLIDAASVSGTGLILIGDAAGKALHTLVSPEQFEFIAVELGHECLGEHTGESRGKEGSNVVGFARFRLGNDRPTQLVEVVRQPATSNTAVDAVRRVFEDAGLVVVVCNDFPGRIVDRLVRPYFNAALRRLDEKLASADDLDKTLQLGLGYPEGPIALLERTGMAQHHDVTQFLHEALGQEAYAPARRAVVAKRRADSVS